MVGRPLKPNREWREFVESMRAVASKGQPATAEPTEEAAPQSPREAEFKALYLRRLERARERHSLAASGIA